jgi:hypothetical protein
VQAGEFELDRRLLLQMQQDVQQGQAVLAAGQAEQDAVAIADHRVIADRATGCGEQRARGFDGLDDCVQARRDDESCRGMTRRSNAARQFLHPDSGRVAGSPKW